MLKLNAALRRRWPILAAFTALGVLLGIVSAVFASTSEPTTHSYRASQVIIARKGASTVLVPQDALKVTRGHVLQRAAEILGDADDPNRAARGVDTTYDQQQSSITVTCKRGRSADAAACVQAFVDAFLTVANEDSQQDDVLQLAQIEENLEETRQTLDLFLQENQAQLEPTDPDTPIDPSLQQQRTELEQTINRLEGEVVERELQLARATPYESLGAEPPQRQSRGGAIAIPASVPLRATVLGIIGLLTGAILVLVLERAHPRLDSREDLLELTDLPVLAEVGYLAPDEQPFKNGTIELEGAWAEPYRRLRAALRFMQSQGGTAPDRSSGTPSTRTGESQSDGEAPREGRPLSILVTSTVPGEGKSTTSALLGIACAEHDNTIVLSADFRRPAVDRLLGTPTGPTLHDRAQLSVERPGLTDLILRTSVDRLYLVSSGPSTREVSGRIDATRAFLQSVSGNATMIVDTSPLAAASDALDLLDSVDYTILTVRAGAITEKQLTESIEVLTRMGTPIMGIVLIASKARRREQQLYYEYYTER